MTDKEFDRHFEESMHDIHEGRLEGTDGEYMSTAENLLEDTSEFPTQQISRLRDIVGF